MPEKKADNENEIEKTQKRTLDQIYNDELNLIKNKLNKKEKLTDEQALFLAMHKERVLKRKEEEQKLIQQLTKQTKEKEKKELIKEYDSAPEEEKITAKQTGKAIGPSGLSKFLASTKIKKVNKKARTKGGEIIIKGHIGKGYEILWSRKPVRYVEFISKNEQGEEVRNITRIVKTKGHLKGSSIPVHLCLEGIADSFDPFEGLETNLSAEYFNKLLMGQFQSGLAVGLAIKPKKADRSLERFMPIILIAVVGCMIILIYFMSQIWEIVSKLPVPAA